MKNPYPTQKGFGLRVAYARRALIEYACGNDTITDRTTGEEYSRINSRAMDNCFENHDGDAVVWALMHAALQEPDRYRQSLMTEGIRKQGAQSGRNG